MRFTALSVIDTVALVVSIAIGIAMAMYGLGYWALVAMSVAAPVVTTICLWPTARWLPGKPKRRVGIRSMVKFGGTITLNGLVVYLAYNLEKVLLGRYWGPAAVGIYGRAYQLVNIPTENLNTAAGGVAFAALSRLQNDPQRFKSYFLKGYSLVLALTMPITIISSLFAGDLILVVLGPKWIEAIPIFRLLAPTILIFAVINPLAWLLFSVGLVKRSLHVALVLAPLVILGYVLGLPHGPKGVAIGYSVVMALWVVPHVAWCIHGTVVSMHDIGATLVRPLASGIVAGAVALGTQLFWGNSTMPIYRLCVGVAAFALVYLVMLLYCFGQKTLYESLLRGLLSRPKLDGDNVLVST